MSAKSKSIIVVFCMGMLVVFAAATQHVDVGRIVYNACQESRMSDTINEGKCASLQDEYKYEYICKEANTSPTNDCWVESNDRIGEL